MSSLDPFHQSWQTSSRASGCRDGIEEGDAPSISVILQGCPEVGEEELVSVPDAKFTKGEFQVGMPPGSLGVLCSLESWVLLAD